MEITIIKISDIKGKEIKYIKINKDMIGEVHINIGEKNYKALKELGIEEYDWTIKNKK